MSLHCASSADAASLAPRLPTIAAASCPGSDGDLESDLHGERVDLRFGQFGQLGGGGFALGAEWRRRRRDRPRRLSSSSARSVFEDFVAVFDFGQLAAHLFAEGDDLGDGLAVLALEAVEQGEAVFDLGEALGEALMPSA